jgi:NADPH-dependent curcumin reductase
MTTPAASSATTGHRIVLARPVEGVPTPDDFRLEAFGLPPLGEGQFRVRNLYLSADPGTRSRLSGAGSYAAALKPGEVVDGFAVGVVEESLNPAYPPGCPVTLGSGWATHVISKGRGYCARLPEGLEDIPLSAWIGVLGVPGMTAWFGLTRVAGLKPGERVLVTSAAGPVGATAGQLARSFGASRVVGVAGDLAPGSEKSAWLSDVARFDALVDHRAPDFEDQVRAACPEGVDVLFDNVGNAMIDRLIPLLRPGGRIVVSGQVADYNVPPEQRPGIRNTAAFITHRLRMEGLVVFDDLKAFPAAQAEAAGLIRAGSLALREITGEGLESLPDLFCGLFASGAAFGRRIARL